MATAPTPYELHVIDAAESAATIGRSGLLSREAWAAAAGLRAAPPEIDEHFDTAAPLLCRHCGREIVSNFEGRGQYGHIHSVDIWCGSVAWDCSTPLKVHGTHATSLGLTCPGWTC